MSSDASAGKDLEDDVGSKEETNLKNDDEYVAAKLTRSPRTLTQQEIDEHLQLHLRRAGWCPDFAEGAGRVDPHRTHDDADKEKCEMISMDYASNKETMTKTTP